MNLPAPPIRRTRGTGFADYTITRRLPQIASQVKDVLPSEVLQDQIDKLVEAIDKGDSLQVDGLAKTSDFWQDYLEQIKGQTWDDLFFFEVEFLFYHSINSLAGFFDLGFDVFAAVRQQALTDALPDFNQEVNTMSWSSPETSLQDLVRRATFGNTGDYSQLEVISDVQGDERSLLVDQSEALVEQLLDPSTNWVEFIADNAGRELCWDLVLIDGILRADVEQVVLQVKPCPMFVSDVLIGDVHQTIEEMKAQSSGSVTSSMGERLAQALDGGKLTVRAADDWGEPRHFSQLRPDLVTRLNQADVVIAKGDLNYRRFVEDRLWSKETSIDQATENIPFSAFALRVLKSEAVAGIPLTIHQSLDAADPDWRCNGKHGVIQKVGR